MRYPEGGGLTAEWRAFREGIRLQAGERFAAGEKTAVIAKDLRVSVRSVERWRVPGARAAWKPCAPRVRRTPRPSPMPSSRNSKRNSARGRQRTGSTISAGPWSGSRR
ncbi:helix-turn-helix domain-containing protein [Streptomyces sp. NPDC018610]|uniref:helix-turn-helix domain-containing protein n=1 Tax=Streptomyces sp. NPDC018610 TaxID=3365049 RepID=UPI00379D5591